MVNIEERFKDFITNYGSPDLAEFEFKKAINDDPELYDAYREWCDEVGSTIKNGFFDYCDEYIEEQNNVWESLNDFDE